MARHRITREQAFGLLRMASQNSNRKLHDVARDVADTGELPPLARDRPPRQLAEE
jgi:AmiR/NasT family two-component response regulator